MKIARISQQAWQLTRLGLVNCYLVFEKDGFTLIDTGISGSADAILETAAELGNPIRRILLTHAHGDHIGSVDALVRKLGSIDLAITRRDARLLSQPPDLSLDPNEPQSRIKGYTPGTGTQPTHFVEEGEHFGSLLILSTPGHTPGHASFLDERDRTLYAGDAVTTVGELRVVGDSPWYFSFPNFATWDKPTALNSVEKLLGIPFLRIAPGHGKVIEATPLELKVAIEHAVPVFQPNAVPA